MDWLHIILRSVGLGYLIYLVYLGIAYLLAFFISSKKTGKVVAALISVAIFILVFGFLDSMAQGWTVITLGIILGIVMIYFRHPSYPKINGAINKRYASRS